ncbi:hypothetical protein [Pseudomonas putida]|uniref:Uncharacterized protein n=1 Tax=Pseudomonas putida TaxID=303 RepID=A0AAW4BXL3_PSEPU|nr:hypothetical protein [Pseudomonas putida]MBF8703052.1 hypothetical protein [Pseudomonas putida]MBF8736908.1 hypothetical protein [Pseudomonas putida]
MKVSGNTRAYPIENQPHSVTEMNTGKQSGSSNKFAILPMWVIDRIKEEMCLGPAAWQAITDAVEQAEVPQALPCEVKLPPGTVLGQGSPLSTLLMAIAQRASQPAHAQVFGSEQEVQQPHPEPIAWMVGTAIWWTKEEAERDAAATGLPMIPVGPMTGAGDIGLAREMLRRALRREDKWAFLCSGRNKQIAELRAQLAERDALLARIVNSGALSSEQYEELEADCCAAVDVVNQIKRQAFREHVDKCAALSASAVPSAPTPQTINGHKLYCKAVDDYKPGQCSCGVEIDHQIPGTSFQRLNALANQGE